MLIEFVHVLLAPVSICARSVVETFVVVDIFGGGGDIFHMSHTVLTIDNFYLRFGQRSVGVSSHFSIFTMKHHVDISAVF